jgi:asparagine synthase (glutamine-hydrolysing)
MSGIAGIYHFGQGRVDPAYLEKMSVSLFHRGPDKQGVWHDHNIGLVSLLLQTTPESLTEELPFYDSEAEIAITADARIDNRAELLALLDCSKLEPKAISDSRLILEAYKKWGVECPKHLLGDFAVVIWDKRKQRLFAFRDHFGVKPFYYFTSEKFFAFASEIKALLLLPQIPCEINEERIADFMAIQDDGSSTFYKDIFTLRPAHFLVSNHTKMVEHRYWALEAGPLLKLRNNNEYTEAFKEIFTESVRCRLRRTGPIGSHMSGGLDSSSIACIARDILVSQGSERLHTFSFFFKDIPECDERKFTDPIVQQGNITPHFVQADHFPTREEYSELQTTFEEAAAAFNVNPVWKIHTLARNLGVNVLLDGFDGDSTVSHGTGRLIELARSMQWITLIREAEGYAGHFSIPRGKSTYYYLKNYSLLSFFLRNAGMIKRNVSNIFINTANNKTENADTVLEKKFHLRINATGRFQQLKSPLSDKNLNEQTWQIQKLTDHGMHRALELLDRCSAHFSIEKRFPFWDKRLIMFCRSLPAEQKLDHGWNRVIMRRAMESVLPPSVCWRGGKTNMTPHANEFIVRLIRSYQLQGQTQIEKAARYLDIKKITTLLKSPQNTLNGPSAIQFYRIIACMIWLNHIEQLSGWEGSKKTVNGI